MKFTTKNHSSSGGFLLWYNESMFAFLFKIWYMIVILPILIFLEGNKMLAKFLKERNIYLHWDVWHSLIVILIILVVVLWTLNYETPQADFSTPMFK